MNVYETCPTFITPRFTLRLICMDPTGIVAECQDGRSQHSNKAKALQVLQARIQETERKEREA